jgi:diguanylate cyclase
MSRQTACLHPVSYAIWYDYVSNRKPDLRHVIDEAMARSGTLDETTTRHLFDRHVADIDADAVAEALAETRAMQGNMKALQVRFDDSQKQIMALREEVRKAREESLLDALTGLANRRAFEQRLAACLASTVAGGESAPCLQVGDIDHFKKINDTWGYPFGDQVIKAVAAVLKAMAPQGALPARVGVRSLRCCCRSRPCPLQSRWPKWSASASAPLVFAAMGPMEPWPA